jgi:carbonic anhydrase/acetyltransferase-like protein (isoleucine patch superfamily)
VVVPFEGAYPEIDPSAFIASGCSLVGSVKIGRDSSVWFGSVLRGDVNSVTIGERTNIQDLSVIHVSRVSPAVLGNDVTAGHRCVIHGALIDTAVLIGMGSIILDGAEIGSESIVGAGSLVTKGKIFPPRSLVLGSPAVLMRSLTDAEIASIYDSSLHYSSLKNLYR